jgi:hypothetical protein
MKKLFGQDIIPFVSIIILSQGMYLDRLHHFKAHQLMQKAKQ